MDPSPESEAISLQIERLRQASRSQPRRRPFPPARAVRQTLEEVKAARPDPPTTGHPWIPEPFVRRFEQQWRRRIRWYVAVDDLDEGIVVFSTAPWPTLDSKHRLVFPDNQIQPFEAPVALVETFLAAYRILDSGQAGGPDSESHEELRTRPLRAGDVFAMSQPALRQLRRLPDFDPGTRVSPRGRMLVFDVTREAREATKVAYYAAAAQTIDPQSDADRELAEVIWSQRRTFEGPEQYA